MVSEYTVLDHHLELCREAFYAGGVVMHHLRPDHDMAEQLAVIRVLIKREIRKLLHFAYVMEHGGCEQQIPVDSRIAASQEVTHFCHLQSVLKKTAHEAVVDSLGCGVTGKSCHELFIIGKEAEKELLQVCILYRPDIVHELAVHYLSVLLSDRKVIRRDILARIGFSHLLE